MSASDNIRGDILILVNDFQLVYERIIDTKKAYFESERAASEAEVNLKLAIALYRRKDIETNPNSLFKPRSGSESDRDLILRQQLAEHYKAVDIRSAEAAAAQYEFKVAEINLDYLDRRLRLLEIAASLVDVK